MTFTAGGIATPADAALCMQLGADGVFVGSGIFKSGDPELRAKAIVEATTHFNDPKILADVSAGLGEPMVGISAASLLEAERLEARGWSRLAAEASRQQPISYGRIPRAWNAASTLFRSETPYRASALATVFAAS